MRLENGKLILERRDCSYCNHMPGLSLAPSACPTCKGSGNGKRGGRGKCPQCSGSGRVYDSGATMPCRACAGNYKDFQAETYCDTIPLSIYQTLPVKVYRTEIPMTVGESLIGLGCLYSCSDYGRAWKNPERDNELVEEVRNQKFTQATKVCKEDGTLCDHIGVFVRPGGFTVKPIFKGE